MIAPRWTKGLVTLWAVFFSVLLFLGVGAWVSLADTRSGFFSRWTSEALPGWNLPLGFTYSIWGGLGFFFLVSFFLLVLFFVRSLRKDGFDGKFVTPQSSSPKDANCFFGVYSVDLGFDDLKKAFEKKSKFQELEAPLDADSLQLYKKKRSTLPVALAFSAIGSICVALALGIAAWTTKYEEFDLRTGTPFTRGIEYKSNGGTTAWKRVGLSDDSARLKKQDFSYLLEKASIGEANFEIQLRDQENAERSLTLSARKATQSGGRSYFVREISRSSRLGAQLLLHLPMVSTSELLPQLVEGEEHSFPFGMLRIGRIRDLSKEGPARLNFTFVPEGKKYGQSRVVLEGERVSFPHPTEKAQTVEIELRSVERGTNLTLWSVKSVSHWLWMVGLLFFLVSLAFFILNPGRRTWVLWSPGEVWVVDQTISISQSRMKSLRETTKIANDFVDRQPTVEVTEVYYGNV